MEQQTAREAMLDLKKWLDGQISELTDLNARLPRAYRRGQIEAYKETLKEISGWL